MIRTLLALSLASVLVGAAPAPQTLPAFHTPSGNIGCIADSSNGGWELRCDIAEKSWRGPAQPRSCDLDYGDALGMSAAGRPYWACHGDTVLGQGAALAYGRTWRAGPFTCLSQIAGVTCSNRTGHGFFLSRASNRVF